MDLNQVLISSLHNRFEGIKHRMLAVINQLGDEAINWRPNEESNSIANLVIHIGGVTHQRIEVGIMGLPDYRDRDSEFDRDVSLTKKEAINIIEDSFAIVEKTMGELRYEDYLKPQKIQDTNVTIMEVFLLCTNHFSEHLGQILYVGKMILDKDYVTTTIPRKL